MDRSGREWKGGEGNGSERNGRDFLEGLGGEWIGTERIGRERSGFRGLERNGRVGNGRAWRGEEWIPRGYKKQSNLIFAKLPPKPTPKQLQNQPHSKALIYSYYKHIIGDTMSITTQVSFPKEREIQLSRIFAKCPSLAELGTSGAIYKILFDAMDRIVPLEKIGDSK